MEVRYGGREARLFRGIYAVYTALGWTSILNGYALSMLIQAAGPVFGRLSPALLVLATGILLAGELAAFLSTVDTQVNWGSSFIIHDLYRPYIKKNASDWHYVAVGRIASGVILVLGMSFGYFYVSEVMAWFLFINSVAVVFILPLSWLRFFWWRHNIYGEAAGLLVGLPLSYAVWFPLGFSDPARHPFWHGFLLLFGLGWLVIIVADLLTPPEKIGTLREFHARCCPPGLWGPVTTGLDREARTKILSENRQSILDGILGVIFCLGAVAALTALIGRRTFVFMVALGLAAVSGTMIYRGHNTNFRIK